MVSFTQLLTDCRTSAGRGRERTEGGKREGMKSHLTFTEAKHMAGTVFLSSLNLCTNPRTWILSSTFIVNGQQLPLHGTGAIPETESLNCKATWDTGYHRQYSQRCCVCLLECLQLDVGGVSRWFSFSSLFLSLQLNCRY